jgi:hypothetical protein
MASCNVVSGEDRFLGNSKRHPNQRKVTRPVSSSVAGCLALALVALVSGCGSKSSSEGRSSSATSASTPTSSSTAFVTRANTICTQPDTGPTPGPFPFPSFDPLHPDRSKLPAIGRYFERTDTLAMGRRELAQLKALGAPPKNQSDWQRLLAAKQSGLSATAKQYKAALATDVPTFIATVNTLTAATSAEVAAASGFGVTGCEPPGANQSGPPPGAQPVPDQVRGALSQLAACMRGRGVAVQANFSGKGPPLTTRVPAADPKYVAAGAACRAQLASRFPRLAQSPTPP